jgi:transcriptional regulator with XRE-family HTH domain
MVNDEDIQRLDQPTLKQRIEAARILRGVSQATLNGLFEKDGLDKTEAGRIERGKVDLTRAALEAFCRHLRVPQRWFTEPDVDYLVGLRPYPGAPLSPEQRAAIQHAAQLIADSSRATEQSEPSRPEGQAGQDRPGGPT